VAPSAKGTGALAPVLIILGIAEPRRRPDNAILGNDSSPDLTIWSGYLIKENRDYGTELAPEYAYEIPSPTPAIKEGAERVFRYPARPPAGTVIHLSSWPNTLHSLLPPSVSRPAHVTSATCQLMTSGTQPDPLQALFLVISWQVALVTCAGRLTEGGKSYQGTPERSGGLHA
jgi:hypothetical protein